MKRWGSRSLVASKTFVILSTAVALDARDAIQPIAIVGESLASS